MRTSLALAAIFLCLPACTRTLEAGPGRPCPAPRAQNAPNGVGIIGMSIDQRRAADGSVELFVDRVVADGPAASAGVRSGDTIVTIDGTATQGMSTGEAARRLRGPQQANVTVGIAAAGGVRPVTITRVSPSELWTGAKSSTGAGHEAERVRASDVAPAQPMAAPRCR